jgi:hypothetical protein
MGHASGVQSVAFSPDGQRILTGSGDRTAKVWDAQTGLSLQGHTSLVMCVAYSPDGQRILTGSHDRTVKVWDAQKGQEVLSLKGHTTFVTSVAFSPDGKRILTGSYENMAKVWDADKGQELLTLKGHTGVVRGVAFSPDGKRVFARDVGDKILAWDGETGKLLDDPPNHMPAATREVTSPDGRLRAFVDRDIGLVVIRVERLPDLIESRKRQEALDRATLQRWARFDPEWHDRQARAAEEAGNAFAATWHLGRLLAHAPDDQVLQRRYTTQKQRYRQERRQAQADWLGTQVGGVFAGTAGPWAVLAELPLTRLPEPVGDVLR